MVNGKCSMVNGCIVKLLNCFRGVIGALRVIESSAVIGFVSLALRAFLSFRLLLALRTPLAIGVIGLVSLGSAVISAVRVIGLRRYWLLINLNRSTLDAHRSTSLIPHSALRTPHSSKWFSIALVLLFTLWGCEAPRNNILDPRHPDYPYVTLEGTVETFTLRQPLEGVAVSWQEGALQTVTDAQGGFRFEAILPSDGWLYFSKAGYFSDSAEVRWGDLEKISLAPRELNALPVIDRMDVYSAVLDKPGSIPSEYFFVIEAEISDPDNDVDSVFWEVSELDSAGFLRFDFTDGRYKGFSGRLIDFDRFSEILIYDFRFSVRDKFARRVEVGRSRIRRVMREVISCRAPLGNAIVQTATPLLEWEPYDPGFAHSYRIEVFKRSGIFVEATPFWTKEAIPAGQQAFQIDQPLDVSEYTWVIWAVDEFGNRIRSSEANFEYRL